MSCYRAQPAPALLGLKALFWFVQVFEAYGQTECTAGCTLTSPGDWTSGRLNPGQEVQLLREGF